MRSSRLRASLTTLPALALLCTPQSSFAQSSGASSRPLARNRFAVVIGVDSYPGDLGPTSGSRDARGLADALRKHAGFPANQVFVLTSPAQGTPGGEGPTRENIQELLSKVTRQRPGNEPAFFLFAFAGHGIQRGDKAYLLPQNVKWNGDVRLLERTALSLSEVEEWIRDASYEQAVLVIDACRNDPLAERGTDASAGRGLAARGIRLHEHNDEIQAYATFFAALPGKRALESPQGGGYLTRAFVKGISGEASDPTTGEVTLGGLADYVRRTVKLEAGQAGGLQEPAIQVHPEDARRLLLATARRARPASASALPPPPTRVPPTPAVKPSAPAKAPTAAASEGSGALASQADASKPSPGEADVDLSVQGRPILKAAEMVAQAAAYREAAARIAGELTTLADQRRTAKDWVRQNCVLDKLSQAKLNLAIIDSSLVRFNETVARGDEAASFHEFTRITICHQKAQVLSAEAQSCMAEDLQFVGTTRVETDVAYPEVKVVSFLDRSFTPGARGFFASGDLPLSGKGLHLSEDTVLHVGSRGEGGFDNNVFYSDQKAPVSAPFFRSTSFLEVDNQRPDRRSFVNFALGGVLTYRTYTRGDDAAMAKRAVLPTAWGLLDVGSAVKLVVRDNLARVEDPPLERAVPGPLTRNSNLADVELYLPVEDGRMSAVLRYTNVFNALEAAEYEHATSMVHKLLIEANWRWLPRTTFFIRTTGSDHNYPVSGASQNPQNPKYDSKWDLSQLGLRGAITETIDTELAAGYALAEYEQGVDPTGSSHLALLAAFHYTTQTSDRLSLGYQREFRDSILANFMDVDAACLQFETSLGRLVISSDFIYEYRRPAVLGRKEHVAHGEVQMDYYLLKWLHLGAGYRLAYSRSTGETAALGPSYTKHELVLGLGINY